MNAYLSIHNQLKRFIQKYHWNEVLRGSIYLLIGALSLGLLLIAAEYFGSFSATTRTILVFLYAAIFTYLVVRFVLLPLARLINLRKGLSNKEAAQLIGKHFPTVSDKLLNILELQELSQNEAIEIRNLIEAGISQKADEIKPVPILKAVDLRQSLRYIKFAIPAVLILLACAVFIPEFIAEPSKRLLAYNQEFAPKAPFSLELEKRNYSVAKGASLNIEVRLLDAAVVPTQIVAAFENYEEPLVNTGTNRYSIQFQNLQESFSFSLMAEGFSFGDVSVSVFPKPVLEGFTMQVETPAYTGISNPPPYQTGDALVPVGSNIAWNIRYNYTDSIAFVGLVEAQQRQDPAAKQLAVKWRAMQDASYGIYKSNAYAQELDSTAYGIQVIPDFYPKITAQLRSDSTLGTQLLVQGNISDDYGLQQLNLRYGTDKNATNSFQKYPLEINRSIKQQEYTAIVDFEKLGVPQGTLLYFYMEVWDNDAVHGSKRTKTQLQSLKLKTKEELLAERNKNLNDGQQDLEKLAESSKKLKDNISKLKRDLLNKNKSDLNDKQKIQRAIQEKQKLEQDLEQLQQQLEQTKKLQENIDSENEELLKKQEELNELMDEVMTEEMNKLFQELDSLMEQLDQDKLMEKLEQIENKTEDFSEELDRSLELLKKLALELQMEETADKLEELAQKQEELSERAEESPEEQQEINEEFDALKEKMEELSKPENELLSEDDADELQEQGEQLQEKLKQNLEDMQNGGNPAKTNEKQKDSAGQMKEMAQKMKEAMESGQSQENAENIEDLKQILENLVTLSVNQEQLFTKLGAISTQDPLYQDYAIKQVNYQADFKVVEDSLNALAKRVAQIKPIIREEVGTVLTSMERTVAEMEERTTAKAKMNQRYAIQSLNNLALLLDEVLRQLEQQQAQSKPGMSNCSKPKPGKGQGSSLSKMRKAQEEMAKKLEEMMKQGKKKPGGQEKGEKPGKQKPGGSKSQGASGSDAQELVQMAAKQAAMRKKLRDMAKELNKDGSGNGNQLNKIAEELEKLEEDLFNDNINPESLLRQREILTKMLEAENAERTQEMDKERKGERANTVTPINPEWEKYLEEKKNQVELLKSLPPELHQYYKRKSENYLNEATP